ncbi:oxygenase MpaB family protein [Jatrophihabitans lederbergiae]|uniref:Oxygenase MpaB family protein n=1 Tax=Jatrophihabitans lederbergiae TaxID=3075547 RepID=A0ABU2JBW5_9ACTN|nr:oxygenase MpaB family protein [Jatrophihabitans sp. DSM 44399]MDT0262475.1 oxygenase MpaB family protein [Jatrophihabitans sp. DSM 44399]
MTQEARETEDELATAHQVYRNVALFELVRDIRVGLNLAFYRTFAVPRIAELLAHTGEIKTQPHKRSMDTGLFMYELIEAGYDSERGRQVVRALNKMHKRWDIAAEDYLYVLTTFIVVPTRWLHNYGPRKLTDTETAAITTFYRELGRRMNIDNLPANYRDAERIFDDYEARNVRYSDAGCALMKSTENVMAEQLPRPLKPAATLLTRLILDDYVAEAVGLAPAPRAGRALMRLVGTIRRRRGHHRHAPRTDSWFKPGRKVEGVYPNGYQFDQLGPRDSA